MVLRIDEAELRAKLFEHKEQIGFGPIANGVVIIIEGLFYIPAALTSGLDQMFRPFAVWCGWVCQVVTVLRSSLPQVR